MEKHTDERTLDAEKSTRRGGKAIAWAGGAVWLLVVIVILVKLASPTPARPAAPTQPAFTGDFALSLDKVVTLPDGDLLYGRLTWGQEPPYSVVSLESYSLVDSQGQPTHITQVIPDPNQMPTPGSRELPLAFKVGGPEPHPGPVKLTIDRLTALLPVKGAGFTLDTSAAFTSGQQWLLNQRVQAGPYAIHVISAERLADGYRFIFQAPPEIGCVDMYVQGANALKGSCGQGMTTAEFDENVPTGRLTILIANLEVHLSGNWQVTWQTPAQ